MFNHAARSVLGRSVARRSASTIAEIRARSHVLGGEAASPQVLKTFEIWHDAVAEMGVHDSVSDATMQAFKESVDEKVVFSPPTYFKPWEGRDEFMVLIECVGEVFGPSFTYGRQWLSPCGREWALEFKADIEDSGRSVDGIDLVSLDESGRIVDFKVLARPPNAVAALKDAMMRKVPPRLAMMKAKQAVGSMGKLFA